MSERNIGLEILEGVREIKDYKKGTLSLRTSQLSVLIPIIGAIALLIFMFQGSKPGENQFGPSPKETTV